MSAADWNWRAPVELQNVPWDCAAASLAWCLQAMGLPYTEADVVAGLGPTRINATYGLLDASGAGIVDWLDSIGIVSYSNPDADYDEIAAAAGNQPMLMGGRTWSHWTGVRMSTLTANVTSIDGLALANPSPGWMDIEQFMTPDELLELGPFSAVWMLVPI